MNLASLIKSSQRGFLKNLLEGAGLTLATSGATLIAFNKMLDVFKNSIGSVPADVLSLAHIAGFDVFFSLIFGAYVTKFTLSSGNLVLKRVGR